MRKLIVALILAGLLALVTTVPAFAAAHDMVPLCGGGGGTGLGVTEVKTPVDPLLCTKIFGDSRTD